jgi:hypothetical protein
LLKLDGGGDRARLVGRAVNFLSDPLSGAAPLIERIWGVQRTSSKGVTETIGRVAARASTSHAAAFSNGRSSNTLDVVRRRRIQQIANASSCSMSKHNPL